MTRALRAANPPSYIAPAPSQHYREEHYELMNGTLRILCPSISLSGWPQAADGKPQLKENRGNVRRTPGVKYYQYMLQILDIGYDL